MNECDVKLIVFLGFEVSRKREEKKGREGNRRRRKRRERERERKALKLVLQKVTATVLFRTDRVVVVYLFFLI